MSICCIGELLIDFVCRDVDADLSDGIHFEKKAGGAPANVAATIGRLGGDVAFVGKVGKDPFGSFLKSTLLKEGVNLAQLKETEHVPTTLAFVSLQKNGERDFIFNRGADGELRVDELDVDVLLENQIFHFGSATALLDGQLYDTYGELFSRAQASGKFLSFDPNYRVDLWKGNESTFLERCRPYLSHADLVKVSEQELVLLTGKTYEKGGASELHDLGASIVTVTLGEKGTLLSLEGKQIIVPSIPVVSIDSTGAGDAFIGALLYQIAQKDAGSVIGIEEWEAFVGFGNRIGALTCTRYGAIEGLPTRQEVEALE